jgi:hypothetical protein
LDVEVTGLFNDDDLIAAAEELGQVHLRRY